MKLTFYKRIIHPNETTKSYDFSFGKETHKLYKSFTTLTSGSIKHHLNTIKGINA